MKHSLKLHTLAPLCALTIVLAGCTFLQPVPDHTRYFLLTAMPSAQSAPIGRNTSALVLGLGPVKLPDYLDRSEIVTRTQSNQVQFSDMDHWAEPLKDNFTHVLAQNLSALLGTQQIVNFPWYSSTHIDYQIAIAVDRFECDWEGNARLAARWSINNPVNGKILYRDNSDLSAPCGTNPDQAVGALSRTAADLSRQIAAAVAQLAVRP